MDKTNFSAKAETLVKEAEKKLKGNNKSFLIHHIGGFFKNLSSSKIDR